MRTSLHAHANLHTQTHTCTRTHTHTTHTHHMRLAVSLPAPAQAPCLAAPVHVLQRPQLNYMHACAGANGQHVGAAT